MYQSDTTVRVCHCVLREGANGNGKSEDLPILKDVVTRGERVKYSTYFLRCAVLLRFLFCQIDKILNSMRNIILTIFLLVCISKQAESQYISEVLEYRPAPGQLINTRLGTPEAANSIVGGVNGMLSLGAFGGYVVFRFAEPVENHIDNPYGVDFTIFGNPMPQWAEPAVVWVMRDDNSNNLPDDTWFELAGSDYFFTSTRKNCTQTYINSDDTVFWENNFSETGYLEQNSYYKQTYYPEIQYFEDISQTSYTLSGTQICANLDSSSATVKSFPRAFGYADNKPRKSAPFTIPDNPYSVENENAGGDAFDISWAVDSDGNYVDLDKIHFIKIQTAISANGGWLGEVSTEITGACVVLPNSELLGNQDFVSVNVPKDTIFSSKIQLEIFPFVNGRYKPDNELVWTSTNANFTVDSNNILHCSADGTTTLTACLAQNSSVFSSFDVSVKLSKNVNDSTNTNPVFKMYPNPVSDFLYLENVENSTLKIYNLSGLIIWSSLIYTNFYNLSVAHLDSGIYLISVENSTTKTTSKFCKQ